MRASRTGVLWSALVFPGLGQFCLKRWFWGAVLLLTALASLLVIAERLARRAYRILEVAEAAGGSVDLVAVLRRAWQESGSDPTLQGAVVILGLSWLVSVVHALLAAPKEKTGSGRAGQGGSS